MAKKVVLQVIAGMDRGGAETFLMNIYRNIDRNEYEFIFLCFSKKEYDYEGELERMGGKIVRVTSPGKNPIAFFLQMASVINEYHVQIIHSHISYGSALPLLVSWLKRVPVRIVHSHNTNPGTTRGPLRRSYYAISSIIIDMCGTYFLSCGVDAGKALYMSWRNFTVINNGIEIQKFIFNESVRREVRNELGIPRGDIVLLHVGRFDLVKNQELLVDIFHDYHNANPRSKLLMVGDGPTQKLVRDKVKKNGLGEDVIFAGKRADVDRIYNAADIFLLPSLYEGLPTVAIEAQVNGLTCKLSDVVDRRARLTGLVDFLSITSPVSKWTSSIVSSVADNVAREGAERQVIDKGYDIKDVVNKLKIVYSKER